MASKVTWSKYSMIVWKKRMIKLRCFDSVNVTELLNSLLFASCGVCVQYFTWWASCSSSWTLTKATRHIAVCDADVVEWNLWNLLQPKPSQLAGLVLIDREHVWGSTSKKQKANQCACVLSDHSALPVAESLLFSRGIVLPGMESSWKQLSLECSRKQSL